MHNKPIGNKKEAWLSFLSFDAPERVIEIITRYPEFKPMYEDVYGICQNVERVINMFSKELREMDRNTVQYMIEEQQEKIEEQQGTIEEQQGTIEELKADKERLMKLTLVMIEHGQTDEVKRLQQDPVFLQEMIGKYGIK